MTTVPYSTRFMLVPAGAGAVYVTATVPAGYRWVVRGMDAVNSGGSASTSQGFQVAVYTGAIAAEVWSVGPPYALYYKPYHWEGHCVLYAGEQLTFQGNDGNWNFQASGFQLTVPIPA